MAEQNTDSDAISKRSGIDEETVLALLKGTRNPRPREAAAIAQALGVPRGWLVQPEPYHVANRKVALQGDRDLEFERELKNVVYNVSLLLREGVLRTADVPNFGELRESHDPEIVAERVRKNGRAGSGPIVDISSFCELFGLLLFVETFDSARFEGSMVTIEPIEMRGRLGVALVNNSLQVGEEIKSKLSGIASTRFAAAHELGHWLTGDPYSAHGTASHEERLVDFFARHLLLSRSFAGRRWHEIEGDQRSKAISISAESGTTWSVTLQQLRYFDHISDGEFFSLRSATPTHDEFADLGYDGSGFEALRPVPLGYKQSVLQAFAKNQLTETRVMQALRASYDPSELPDTVVLPGKLHG